MTQHCPSCDALLKNIDEQVGEIRCGCGACISVTDTSVNTTVSLKQEFSLIEEAEETPSVAPRLAPGSSGSESPSSPVASMSPPRALVAISPVVSRSANPRPGTWRRCLTHPTARSKTVCPSCRVGYCATCRKTVCPSCDTACVPTTEYDAWQAREKRRARPMGQELATIFSYPWQDPVVFVLLAVFTGIFGFMARYSPYANMFAKGVLLWYCFHALSQIARGNLKHAPPEFDKVSELSQYTRLSVCVLIITWGPLMWLGSSPLNGQVNDLSHNIQQGGQMVQQLVEDRRAENEAGSAAISEAHQARYLAERQRIRSEAAYEDILSDKPANQTKSAFSQSSGLDSDRLSALIERAQNPSVQRLPASTSLDKPGEQTQEPITKLGDDNQGRSAERPSPTPATVEASRGGLLLLVLAFLWLVFYTPVALIVAGLSKKIVSTLNPLAGLETVRRMGGLYGQTMLIYTGLAAVQWLAMTTLGQFFVVGDIIMAFINAYFYLAVGCTLGLAVFKKAEELGWN